MKKPGTLLILLSLIAFSALTFGQSKINTTLSKQIDSLRDEDQKPAKMPADKAPAEFQLAIHRNFPLVKQIFEKYGFPGYDLVGKVSSHNYWLCVQHSDFDLNFQKDVLKAMKNELDKSNASGQDYAYLTDRVSLNEGHLQIYGTQINMSPKGTTIKPCIDTANLDKRRLAVGLSPIKEYLKKSDEIYHELNKDPDKPKTAKDTLKKN